MATMKIKEETAVITHDVVTTGVSVLMFGGLIGFELFNYDTTRFAMENLLGTVAFAGIKWASILSFALCSIDLAGILRIQTRDDNDKKIYGRELYLIIAWFIGTILNALMTWWAVGLTMLNHSSGNELLSRDDLLTYVPVIIAAAVWITRLTLFGAYSSTQGYLVDHSNENQRQGHQQNKNNRHNNHHNNQHGGRDQRHDLPQREPKRERQEATQATPFITTLGDLDSRPGLRRVLEQDDVPYRNGNRNGR